MLRPSAVHLTTPIRAVDASDLSPCAEERFLRLQLWRWPVQYTPVRYVQSKRPTPIQLQELVCLGVPYTSSKALEEKGSRVYLRLIRLEAAAKHVVRNKQHVVRSTVRRRAHMPRKSFGDNDSECAAAVNGGRIEVPWLL